jgi:hypothetical protein
MEYKKCRTQLVAFEVFRNLAELLTEKDGKAVCLLLFHLDLETSAIALGYLASGTHLDTWQSCSGDGLHSTNY